MRIGLGFDIHRLEEGRPLLLGGVRFDFPKGLVGHSDADVVLHAVCDAVLGAAGLGDIGEHFPDTDEAFKGADSRELLARAVQMVREKGLEVLGVDCVVMAEAPKIAPKREAIRQALAEILGAPVDRVSVKGKTFEGLGPIGRGEAIAAQAVAQLEQPEDGRRKADNGKTDRLPEKGVRR